MIEFMDLLTLCSELDEELSNLNRGDKQRNERIIQHLNFVDEKYKYTIPDFEKGLHWMNVASPLSLCEHLRGNIVILDFFTYCCINCVHVLPDLEAVENKYSLNDGVVVLGVHSAKFENEKVSANILSAILRYNIHHPVVNDHDALLWNQLQIQCWPTFVVIGPEGQFLHTFVGEGHRDNLMEFIEITLQYYKTSIVPCKINLSLEKDKINESPLQFPGKITCSADGKTLVVSDTGHNRILILSSTGVVQHCIGGTDKGFVDGNFTEARFNSPQGVAVLDKTIYVADTDNHAIRKICLTSGKVLTLAGSGVQGQDKEGGKHGTDQELSSPWDLVLGKSTVDGEVYNLLYIAMAGTHQIWVYFIQDGNWLKGSNYKVGTCLRFSGSGQEENRNNSYPTKAGFAQPSGLALSSSMGLLFVADSESSTVRKVSLKDGGVKNLVGGEFDPMNLFAYGDKDGKGINCKLQHPLGVALVTDESGPLLIADSYNHKIKSVDVKTSESKTLVGPDMVDGVIHCKLNEPGGLYASGDKVYIADTNNHQIREIDLITQSVQSLPVIFSVDEYDAKPKSNIKLKGSIEEMENFVLTSGGVVTFSVEVSLPHTSHLTDDAPSSWILYTESDSGLIEVAKGKIQSLKPMVVSSVQVTNKLTTFYCQCKVLHCGEDNVCKMTQKIFKQQVIVDPESLKSNITCHIHLIIS